jgi:pimeloyl-ACP methyl ester carboxylesterase
VIAAELAIQAPSLVRSLVLLEPAIMPADAASAFMEGTAPMLAAHRSGHAAKAVDLFLSTVCGPDWRTIVTTTVPGGPEQAEKDAATFFETELSTFVGWGATFDTERAARLSQPVQYVIGSESVPLVQVAKQNFRLLVPRAEQAVIAGVNHCMQMQDPKAVAATIADFVSRHRL